MGKTYSEMSPEELKQLEDALVAILTQAAESDEADVAPDLPDHVDLPQTPDERLVIFVPRRRGPRGEGSE